MLNLRASNFFFGLVASCLLHAALVILLNLPIGSSDHTDRFSHSANLLGDQSGSDTSSVGVTFVTPNNVESIWRESNPADMSPELWARMSFGIYAEDREVNTMLPKKGLQRLQRPLTSRNALVNAKADNTKIAKSNANNGNSEGGNESGAGTKETGIGNGDNVNCGTISRARVIRAPVPAYPAAARAAGFEGQVLLKLEVAENGRVRKITVVDESGCPECDQVAISTIMKSWLFVPAQENVQPVSSVELIQVVFELSPDY